MAEYGCSITKRVAFRGGVQHFSNIYHFATSLPSSDLPALNALVDEVVRLEKLMHSASVTFVSAALWTSGGTQQANQMIIQRSLTGAGSVSSRTAWDRERAFLIQWSAGRNSRGRPVKLRKWYHTCGADNMNPVSDAQLENTTELSAGTRAWIAGLAEQLRNFTISNTPVELQAKSGRRPDGAAICHRYLEHHQLGDEWRG